MAEQEKGAFKYLTAEELSEALKKRRANNLKLKVHYDVDNLDDLEESETGEIEPKRSRHWQWNYWS